MQYWLSKGHATRCGSMATRSVQVKPFILIYLTNHARMAKSADAADLKSAGRKAVGVQVPLRAPDRAVSARGNVCKRRRDRGALHGRGTSFSNSDSAISQQLRLAEASTVTWTQFVSHTFRKPVPRGIPRLSGTHPRSRAVWANRISISIRGRKQ
jgi:hypothetical protein